MEAIIPNKRLPQFSYQLFMSVECANYSFSQERCWAEVPFKPGYFLATAEVAEESVFRKPSIFCFEITAVNFNVVNYICHFCCLSLEI